MLPDESLDSRLVGPLEGPEEEHRHGEDIRGEKDGGSQRPRNLAVDVGVQEKEDDGHGVVSELHQRRRDEGRRAGQEERQRPDPPPGPPWRQKSANNFFQGQKSWAHKNTKRRLKLWWNE